MKFADLAIFGWDPNSILVLITTRGRKIVVAIDLAAIPVISRCDGVFGEEYSTIP